MADQKSTTESPRDAVNRGQRLKKDGDITGARAAYQKAIDSGDPDQVPRAWIDLGVLLDDQGDQAGAKAAYQRSIDSGHKQWMPHAANNLGLLLKSQKDFPGAKTAFQKAVDSGHVDFVARAANSLGIVLEDLKDVAGARSVYKKAIDSGNVEYASCAARNLGALEEAQGDVGAARAAYQKAIDLDHPDHSARAAVSLGIFLHNLGDTAGAYLAYHRAVDSGHVDQMPLAHYNLGILHQYRRNDAVAARSAYEKVVKTHHATWASKAKEMIEGIKEPEKKDAGESKHPAYSLTAEMTKDDVRRLLGPPSKSWRYRQLRSEFSASRDREAIRDREYWLYEDTPSGRKTYIVMSHRGVLLEDATVTDGKTSEKLGPPTKDGEQAELTYPAPARFSELVLPNGGRWQPTDYEVRFYRSLDVPALADETAAASTRFESCRATMRYLVQCLDEEATHSEQRLRQGALHDLIAHNFTDLRTLADDEVPPIEVTDQYYYDAVDIVGAIARV